MAVIGNTALELLVEAQNGRSYASKRPHGQWRKMRAAAKAEGWWERLKNTGALLVVRCGADSLQGETFEQGQGSCNLKCESRMIYANCRLRYFSSGIVVCIES